MVNERKRVFQENIVVKRGGWQNKAENPIPHCAQMKDSAFAELPK
ncbi:MAG: hypothetical protein JWQ40_2700 [Segetibacter sp.]|nr:hypothetical protein [Segetibacter sp.]